MTGTTIGDTSTGTTTSVDSEVALFSGTGGKTLKRATGTGLAVLTSGVQSTVTAPAGTVVGTTDTQTLTHKTLTDATNTFPSHKINGVPFNLSADVVTPPGWGPSDYGWIDWNYDPIQIYTGTALTGLAGDLFLVGIPIRFACTITNVLLYITVAGATLTTGQNFASLYQGGNLLAATADQHTAWQSTGLQTMALTTPQAVTASMVYVGFYWNGTTSPSFANAIAGTSAIDFVNLGSVHRNGFDSTNTGRTTTPPATIGTFQTNYLSFWAAVS